MTTALYPRVSTQEQAVNGHSIDEQIERMTKYCDAMGWSAYQVYTDAGYSGASTERPALQRMIRDIKAGKIKRVLVYKLDRLSRSQKDTLELIEDVFLANGCDFVSMNEKFDTSTPFGRAMIGILAVFAQLEREQIKERMAMGKEARAKKGKFHGSGHIPIGYDYIDGELVINDFEKLQVQKIFEMYASGAGTKKIAQTLNNSGMHHKYGEWKDTAIRDIITKRTYIGDICYAKKWYKGTHEPFIDEELFNKVQVMREQKAKEHKEHNRRAGKAVSYLGGYIECACCHGKYSKQTLSKVRNGVRYHYENYICNSRSKRSERLIKDPNCKNKIWRMKELDDLVFSEIKKLSVDPDYIAEIKSQKIEDERPEIINKEIKKLDDQLTKLMDLYSIGGMPVEILQDKIHDLNDQKIKLEHELENIKKENAEKLSQEDAFLLVQSFEDILEAGDIDEIRSVIGTLIEKVVVDEDDITIHWNFV